MVAYLVVQWAVTEAARTVAQWVDLQVLMLEIQMAANSVGT
jgi:hypothetical protein